MPGDAPLDPRHAAPSMPLVAPASVLIIEDEPEVRAMLCRGFAAAGFTAHTACGREEILAHARREDLVLVTLDLTLGGVDGLGLAREIRAVRNVPIIIVTGKVAPDERVRGLEHGADDYVTKPFLFREVLIRAQALIERYRHAAPSAAVTSEELYQSEIVALNVPRRSVIDRGGARIDLTDAEFELLLIFLRHPQRILSRDEIMMMMRGHPWSPLDRTLDGHVARLRRKVEPDAETPRLIRTVRGVGYVFTSDVARA